MGGGRKKMDGVPPGRPQSFRYQRRDQWTTAVQDEGEWEQGAERWWFMTKWVATEKVRAGLRHEVVVVVCPNVTGRTKDRIAQSKRVRVGSLAIIVNLYLPKLWFAGVM